LVESWSKENSPSAGSALVHKERAKGLGWGTKQALVPCCKVLECSQAECGMDAPRDFYSLTQREKKKKATRSKYLLLVEVEGEVDGKK